MPNTEQAIYNKGRLKLELLFYQIGCFLCGYKVLLMTAHMLLSCLKANTSTDSHSLINASLLSLVRIV